MATVDLTVASNSTTITSDITEPSTDLFHSIDLLDVKEYLEAHYGEEEEKRRKRRLKRKHGEFIEAQDLFVRRRDNGRLSSEERIETQRFGPVHRKA